MPIDRRNRPARATSDTNKIVHDGTTPTDTVQGSLKVSRGDPLTTASVLISERFSHDGKETLRWWRDEFWHWDGQRYKQMSEMELESIILVLLEGRIEGLRPCHATEVMKCMRAKCRVPSDINPPAFVGGDKAIERYDIISFANGLADMTTLTSAASLKPHTPEWFSMTTLPFDYDPDAICPRWDEFLNEVFDDEESIDLLQRWFGYLLTQDTRQQKLLLLVGPTRAGKGTVGRVIKEVFGDDNVTSPQLNSLGTEFGLQQLIGKSIALLPDAHLSRRADDVRILEVLKGIVGEDVVNVNRKFLPHLTSIRLPVRFVIIVNDLPEFSDPSGAFAARLCILPFPNSFVGMEDRTLGHVLKQEAPGIMNWAIDGYKRLREKGEFNVPQSAIELHDSYRRSASPIRAFIDDCCVLGAGYVTPVDELYARYQTWAKANGLEPLGKTTFGQRLRLDGVRLERQRLRRNGGARRPHYRGIGVEAPDTFILASVPSCPQGFEPDERYRERIKKDYEEENERIGQKPLGTTRDNPNKRPDRATPTRFGRARRASKVDPKGETT